MESVWLAVILSLLLTFFNELEITKRKWFVPLAFTILVYACIVMIKDERGLAVLCAAIFVMSVC